MQRILGRLQSLYRGTQLSPKAKAHLALLFMSLVVATVVILVASVTILPSLTVFSWRGICWLVGATLLIYLAMLWRESKLRLPSLPRRQPREKPDKENHKKFILKLGPILTWHIFRLVFTTVIAGLLVAGLWASLTVLVLIANQLGAVSFGLPTQFWILAWAIFWLYGLLVESQPTETVPEASYWAVITFRGYPLPIVRTTGVYGWQGTAMGLGRTTKKVGREDRTGVGEFSDANGFIRAGLIQFAVWNTADSETANTIITAPAKNRAQIKASMTIIGQVMNPLPLLKAEDPEQDLGDRARQEFRELVGWFVDTDLSALQEAAGEILAGATLITCFLPKAIDGYKKGGMIRDTGDQVMFELIHEEDKHRQQEIIDEFKQLVEATAPQDLKEVVSRNGEIQVSEVVLTKPIKSLMHELGIKLIRITIGDVVLADEVTEAANVASAQPDQHATQLASARANKEARQLLLPTEDELTNPAWQDAMYLAAAQDPDMKDNTQVVIVPGGNRLAQAAVAGATQLRKKT